LGPVAARLREVEEALNDFPYPKPNAFVKAFTQLLRQNLFEIAAVPCRFRLTTDGVKDRRLTVDLLRVTNPFGGWTCSMTIQSWSLEPGTPPDGHGPFKFMAADDGVEDQRLTDLLDACNPISAQSPTAGAEDQPNHRQPERRIRLDRLGITYSLINDQVLIDLQKEAFAVGQPKPWRQPVQREALMEQRDKLVYEKACDVRTTYSEIQGIVRRKYPSSQNLGYLHVSVGRIFQIAREYAERHGLPKPPPRQHRS
jgi:hypothetical protein